MTYNVSFGDCQNGTNAIAKISTHDARNRLVKISTPISPSPISSFVYNGLDWCIIKTSDTDADGNLDQRRFRYYDAEWQLLEERIDEESPFQADPATDIDSHVQYLWGLCYLDDIVARCENNNLTNDSPYVTYEDTWYHMTDAIFSTVAILDDSAALVERANYDSYGDVMMGICDWGMVALRRWDAARLPLNGVVFSGWDAARLPLNGVVCAVAVVQCTAALAAGGDPDGIGTARLCLSQALPCRSRLNR